MQTKTKKESKVKERKEQGKQRKGENPRIEEPQRTTARVRKPSPLYFLAAIILSDSSSAKNRSASNAAMQPLPAEVTACRHFLSWTSPAAKTPLTDVREVPGSVMT